MFFNVVFLMLRTRCLIIVTVFLSLLLAAFDPVYTEVTRCAMGTTGSKSNGRLNAKWFIILFMYVRVTRGCFSIPPIDVLV